MTLDTLLAGLLLQNRPESVCVLDAQADALIAAVLPHVPRVGPEVVGSHALDLVLGLTAFDELDSDTARTWIHQLRLYVAPRMLLRVNGTCALDEAAFLALGFDRVGTDPATGARIHAYDLNTYKSVPDWLNARYWAHPEQWKP